MRERLLVVIPSNTSLPSINVRLINIMPYLQEYVDIVVLRLPERNSGIVGRVVEAIKLLIQLKRDAYTHAYVIKPYSILISTAVRISVSKLYMDINDPIHLEIHGGRISRIRLWAYMMMSDGLIVESPEYLRYLKQWNTTKRMIGIEDSVPNNSLSDLLQSKVDKSLIWFGSPETSLGLSEHVMFFKELCRRGWQVRLLGCHATLIKVLGRGLEPDELERMEFRERYSQDELYEELKASQATFVPYFSKQDRVRGNLKCKLGLAFGCFAVASDVLMHRRLLRRNKSCGMLISRNTCDVGVQLDEIIADHYDKEECIESCLQISKETSFRKHAQRLYGFIFNTAI